MTDLDKALKTLNADPEEVKAKMNFYGLLLNTIFFVPIKKVNPDKKDTEKGFELPLIIENEGRDFLVFFDQQDRLNSWAGKHVPCAQLPGFALAEISSAEVYWEMNAGTDYNKTFAPEEIAWLKAVIARSKQ